MALIDTKDEYVEPTPVTVTVTLEHDAAELWNELTRRTGWDASELVGWALGAQWREMEGIVLPPAQSREEADRLVAEGTKADLEGRVVPQEEVFAKLDAKYGADQRRSDIDGGLAEPQSRFFSQEEMRARAARRLADLTPEQAAECYAAIDAIERGEGIPHEQVVAETKAKFGW